MRWWNLFYEKYPCKIIRTTLWLQNPLYHYRYHQIWQFTACCNLLPPELHDSDLAKKIATIPKPLRLALGRSAPVKRLPLRLISMPMVIMSLLQVRSGLGKRTLITRLLQAHAKQKPTPNDWVYVHNFVDARTGALTFLLGWASNWQMSKPFG